MLGVHPAHSYLYFLILSPVGSYYAEGVKPVRILASDSHVRAVKGGLGEAKTAANYAASLAGQRDAAAAGYTQVLYLDGVHRKYLDEVGTMNIMVRIGDEVITPPLAGTILDGVTRNSALTLLRDWGLRISERPITIDEVMQAGRDGTLAEMWAPAPPRWSPRWDARLQGRGCDDQPRRDRRGDRKLYDSIVGIQYGRTNDPHGWTSVVAPVGKGRRRRRAGHRLVRLGRRLRPGDVGDAGAEQRAGRRDRGEFRPAAQPAAGAGGLGRLPRHAGAGGAGRGGAAARCAGADGWRCAGSAPAWMLWLAWGIATAAPPAPARPRGGPRETDDGAAGGAVPVGEPQGLGHRRRRHRRLYRRRGLRE